MGLIISRLVIVSEAVPICGIYLVEKALDLEGFYFKQFISGKGTIERLLLLLRYN